MVDGLIFVFVLLTIGAIVLVGFHILTTNQKNENEIETKNGHLTYNVVIYGLESDELEAIKAMNEEATVKNGEEKSFGALVGEPIVINNEEGEAVEVDLTINAEGSYVSQLGYFIDGEQIRIGSPIKLLINDREYNGYCTGIVFEEQEEVAQ